MYLRPEALGRSESIEFALKNELYLNVFSITFQNVPFLIIRIVIWVRFNTFNLGFVVKNVITTVFCFANWLRLLKVLERQAEDKDPEQPVVSLVASLSVHLQ